MMFPFIVDRLSADWLHGPGRERRRNGIAKSAMGAPGSRNQRHPNIYGPYRIAQYFNVLPPGHFRRTQGASDEGITEEERRENSPRRSKRCCSNAGIPGRYPENASTETGPSDSSGSSASFSRTHQGPTASWISPWPQPAHRPWCGAAPCWPLCCSKPLKCRLHDGVCGLSVKGTRLKQQAEVHGGIQQLRNDLGVEILAHRPLAYGSLNQ